MCSGKISRIDLKTDQHTNDRLGAGAGCDGQVLVYQDMLAMFGDFKPEIDKAVGQIGEQMKAAFSQYIKEVQNGVFPAEQHTYGIRRRNVNEKLY